MSALQLPTLNVEAKAELVANNLPAFESAFRAGLDGLKYELLNDDDFDKAKDDIKSLKEAEDAIKAVDQEIVNGSADIKTLRESLAKLGEEARQFRLSREKEVKERDEELKTKIIEDALTSIDHPKRERFRPELEDAVKGKRGKNKFANMKKSANALSQSVNDKLKTTRYIIDQFVDVEGVLLIPDRLELELSDAESLKNELHHRVQKKQDEDEKARLQAKLDAEKKANEEERQRVAAKIEQDRLERESKEAKTREDVNKTSSSSSPDVDSSNDSTSLRPDGGDLRPASKSGNHFDKRPAEPENEETAQEEMKRSIATFENSLAPMKANRSALKHPENIELWGDFAKELGKIYTAFKSKIK